MNSTDSRTNAPVADDPFGSQDDNRKMTEMIAGYRISQIVHTVARYSFADHMGDDHVTASRIAAIESLDEEATFRFMRACVTVGLMTYDAPTDTFCATSLLRTLRTDNPIALRSRAMFAVYHPVWTRLAEAVRTGESQTAHALGCDFWTYLQNHPAQSATFNDTMKGYSSAFDRDVAALIDTKSVHLAVDVGGGNGKLLQALLLANPSLHGTAFDLPSVVAGAEESARAPDMRARFSTVAGDFFVDVLPPANLYLMKFVLHNWDDEACVALLRNCRRSIRPGGRLFVAEALLGKSAESATGAMLDLNMLVLIGGKVRSREQLQELFVASKFRLVSAMPTSAAPFSLVEAAPV
ncbi:methyltransferase [Paraburkholderia humisilvae]|uniref:methyltransferase n=1 Tax=Paraburkholderia humisilvae TaxID=627669 RepID=UPI003612674C